MIKRLYLKLNPELPLKHFSSLFSQLSIFSEIYVFIKNFKQDFLYIFEFAKLIKDFLQKYSFCKVNLNLVQPFAAELKPFYLMLSELVKPFNLEGYTYQVTPRLIIFPILCSPPLPESAGFLKFLEQNFMPPGVLVTEGQYPLAAERIERVFLTTHKEHMLSLGYQELVSMLLEKMREQNEDILNPCHSLVIDEKGHLYPCLAAYENRTISGNLLKGTFNAPPLREICPQCKYQALLSLENTPLVSQTELGNLHFRFGLSYFGLQDLEVALSHFLKALEFSPEEEHSDIYLYLGLCEANLGRYPLAIDHLKKANIWNYNAYFYLGFCYFQQKDYLRARDALKNALSLKPPLEDKLAIALYLATTYRELEEFEEAINLVQELAKWAPEVREIYNLMGICYFKTRRYKEASECFKNAIRLAPDSAIDYANLGLSLKALGEKEQAKFYCQTALSLDPSLDFAEKALKELESGPDENTLTREE